MKKVEIHELTAEELKDMITKAVSSEFKKHSFSLQGNSDLISRKEAAKIFHVTLSTIDSWCLSGKLKPYKIGNRVRFKRSELDKSLKPLNY